MRKKPIVELERLKLPRIDKLWEYDNNDLSTHLYLGFYERGNAEKQIVWIVNPRFKFKDKVTWIDWSNVDEKPQVPTR